ncbi:MAG: hypothetical protein ACKO3N_04935, partial [Verrucomicrobiota bacterium]
MNCRLFTGTAMPSVGGVFRGTGWWAAVLAGLAGWLARAAGEGPAPEYLVRHWGREEGLPSKGVMAMARSREGYLWVATPAGLCRFDGE